MLPRQNWATCSYLQSFTSAKDTNLFLQHILALDANKEKKKKSIKENISFFLSSNKKYLVLSAEQIWAIKSSVPNMTLWWCQAGRLRDAMKSVVFWPGTSIWPFASISASTAHHIRSLLGRILKKWHVFGVLYWDNMV